MKSRQTKLKLIQAQPQVTDPGPKRVVHDERGIAIWSGQVPPLDPTDGLSLVADSSTPEATWDPYDRPATLLRPDKGPRR
jgi:hypothetical protein